MIPIVRTPTADDARAVIGAIIEGGISTIEVTMTDLVDVAAIREGLTGDITEAARKYLAIVAEARK